MLPVGLKSYMPKNASWVARADLAAAAATSTSAASSMAASSAESARLAEEAESASMRIGVTRRPGGGLLLCAANGWPIGTPIATTLGLVFLAKHVAQEFQQLGLAAAVA